MYLDQFDTNNCNFEIQLQNGLTSPQLKKLILYIKRYNVFLIGEKACIIKS